MSETYLTPKEWCEAVSEIKKSRFVSRIYPASERAEALARLQDSKQVYPDARHHCWAYIIGSPHSPRLVAMSDDGEPSGTAGKPILNVMQHQPIGDVIVVVSRYFGGIKLGAGGLVRAYSQASQQVYQHVVTRSQTSLGYYLLRCDFSDEQALRHWLSSHAGQVLASHYREQVQLHVALPTAEKAALAAKIAALKNSAMETAAAFPAD